MNPQRRLGWIALALLLGAALAVWKSWGDDQESALAGSLMRLGILCGLFWLAWPDLRRLNPWILGLGAVGMLIVFRWPKLFPVAVLLLAALYFLRPRAPAR